MDEHAPAKRSILGMNMRTTVDIGTLIEWSPEIRKGGPALQAPVLRSGVLRVAQHGPCSRRNRRQGGAPHASSDSRALAYYHANRDEIDSDIAAEDAAVEEIFSGAGITAVSRLVCT